MIYFSPQLCTFSNHLFVRIFAYVNCCELTLIHNVTHKDALILAGKHSSQVHICATEYWQLVMTCIYTNLFIKEHLYYLACGNIQQNVCQQPSDKP